MPAALYSAKLRSGGGSEEQEDAARRLVTDRNHFVAEAASLPKIQRLTKVLGLLPDSRHEMMRGMGEAIICLAT